MTSQVRHSFGKRIANADGQITIDSVEISTLSIVKQFLIFPSMLFHKNLFALHSTVAIETLHYVQSLNWCIGCNTAGSVVFH